MELGRQDSNLGSRDQNPLPYHLATPHHRQGNFALGVHLRPRSDGGRAGKAATALMVGAARRRLSTWLRPNAVVAENLAPTHEV